MRQQAFSDFLLDVYDSVFVRHIPIFWYGRFLERSLDTVWNAARPQSARRTAADEPSELSPAQCLWRYQVWHDIDNDRRLSTFHLTVGPHYPTTGFQPPNSFTKQAGVVVADQGQDSVEFHFQVCFPSPKLHCQIRQVRGVHFGDPAVSACGDHRHASTDSWRQLRHHYAWVERL